MALTNRSLSAHLLSLYKENQKAATTHPFLERAGKRTLELKPLQEWLIQDRFYALVGYTRFLGLLISKLPLAALGPSHENSQKQRKRLSVLCGAMANIDREIGFFEDVARNNGIDLGDNTAPDGLLGLVAPITKSYIDYMNSVASNGTFEEGMVLLWAMEKLYLEAWTYASKQPKSTSTKVASAPASRALDALIPNWSGPEFVAFVRDIEELVDGLDVGSDERLARVEELWRNILWLEERFWPDV